MSRSGGLPGRLVGSGWFWAVFIGVLFAAPLARGLRDGRGPPPPPVLGPFPAFALLDDRGASVGSEQLRGHAFIANLLPTRAVADGALAAAQMRTLQHRARNLGDALLLVSFSPDGDPASLTAVRKQKPSSHRWTLLAGAPDAVRAAFPDPKGLLLVDDELRIRGHYDAGDLDGVLRDASLALNMKSDAK